MINEPTAYEGTIRFLSTLFPQRPRPRTVIHAGALLMKQSGGVRALRRYLRAPRGREVFLVHRGQEPLRDVAQNAGVPDITLEAPAGRDANAAAEMALGLGARRLDFTIDAPALSGPEGERLREIGVSEAEAMARRAEVRPTIRAKLNAGCAALRNGVARVRFGDPEALAKQQATVVLPDLGAAGEVRLLPPAREGSEPEAGRASSQGRPPLVAAGRIGSRASLT